MRAWSLSASEKPNAPRRAQCCGFSHRGQTLVPRRRPPLKRRPITSRQSRSLPPQVSDMDKSSPSSLPKTRDLADLSRISRLRTAQHVDAVPLAPDRTLLRPARPIRRRQSVDQIIAYAIKRIKFARSTREREAIYRAAKDELWAAADDQQAADTAIARLGREAGI